MGHCAIQLEQPVLIFPELILSNFLASWHSACATQTHLRGAKRGCGSPHPAHTPHTLWGTM